MSATCGNKTDTAESFTWIISVKPHITNDERPSSLEWVDKSSKPPLSKQVAELALEASDGAVTPGLLTMRLNCFPIQEEKPEADGMAARGKEEEGVADTAGKSSGRKTKGSTGFGKQDS
jgi:hypothetical protein